MLNTGEKSWSLAREGISSEKWPQTVKSLSKKKKKKNNKGAEQTGGDEAGNTGKGTETGREKGQLFSRNGAVLIYTTSNKDSVGPGIWFNALLLLS